MLAAVCSRRLCDENTQLSVGTINHMSSGKAWAIYISLRVAFFAVPFGLLLWLGSIAWMPWWLALIVATLIGAALSSLFLNTARSDAARTIADWRERRHTKDDLEEDAVIESKPTTHASE